MLADRFNVCADALAVEYFDAVEKQPVEYPLVVNVTAFVLGAAATAVIGASAVSATDPGSAGTTGASAAGLFAGVVILVLRPIVADGWNWLREPRLRRQQP